jgi:hypothetical protein
MDEKNAKNTMNAINAMNAGAASPFHICDYHAFGYNEVSWPKKKWDSLWAAEPLEDMPLFP